jgi:filamentous hemagglutinin
VSLTEAGATVLSFGTGSAARGVTMTAQELAAAKATYGSASLAEVGTVRSLPGSVGHFGAKDVLPGGTGTALTGHGGKFADDGVFIVPEGTAVTLPRPGIQILDRTGQYIERGDWQGLAALASRDPRVARDIEGMASWLPGSEIPSYTLFAPDKKITLFSNSHSVYKPTLLKEIIEPNMGCIQWAVCTEFLPFNNPNRF